jgi:hypothetical protein
VIGLAGVFWLVNGFFLYRDVIASLDLVHEIPRGLMFEYLPFLSLFRSLPLKKCGSIVVERKARGLGRNCFISSMMHSIISNKIDHVLKNIKCIAQLTWRAIFPTLNALTFL